MKNLLCIICLCLLAGCNGDKFLEEAKPGIGLAQDEFTKNSTLDDLVRGAYFNMKSPGEYGPIDLLLYQTIASDLVEMKEYSNVVSGNNNMLPLYLRQPEVNDIRIVEYPWSGAQSLLFNVNTVLDFYDNNEAPKDGQESWVPRIQGESYFLRAFAHYLLVTTYAPPYSSAPNAPSIILQTVPSRAPTDFKGRATNQQVYDQIVSDLKMAIQLLPVEYDANLHPEDYQDRAMRDAARFLLAKVYFLMGNKFWTAGQGGDGGALEQINAVIDSGRFPLVQGNDLKQIFLKSGLAQKASETVWYGAYYFRNGWRAPRFERHFSNFTSNNRDRGFAMSKAILNQIGWNDATVAKLDKRYNEWYRRYENGNDPAFRAEDADDYNVWSSKFTNPTANFVFFRSPELYLMRAAIRLAAGNAADAAKDLNVTRTRAGLPTLATATQTDVSAEWIKEMGFEGRRLFYLQAMQMSIPPGDRAGASAIPYGDPSLVRMLPRAELTRNPALN